MANQQQQQQQHEKKKLDHFSHKHQLTLIEDEKVEMSKSDEYSKNRSLLLRCYGCTEKIGSGVPYYRCEEHCPSFCLHHACAHLPTTIRRLHSEEVCDRDLQLMKRPNKDKEFCTHCWKDWYRFAYVCSDCGVGIDVRCAMKGPNQAKHSFHQHPVEPFFNQWKVDGDDSRIVCSVCRIIITPLHGGRYVYYRCNYCNFIVHPDCTDIPLVLESPSHHHQHDLYLDFDNPDSKICKICQEEIDPTTQWAYKCGDCYNHGDEYYIHAGYEGCLTSTIREGDGVTIDASEVVHLPLDGEPILEKKVTNGKMTKHHRHPMILFADQLESNAVAITTAFMNLIGGSETWPIFRIKGKDYSGLTFSFYDGILTMQVTGVDLPRYIKHEDHPHVLESTFLNSSTWCHACEQFFFGRGFKCTTCAHTIDTYCALLPKMIKHRYDKHGFSLTYSAIEGVEEYVCEICEEDVTPRYFYHCEACDQSIHSRCIWKAYVQFAPYYKFDFDRRSVILVPPREELPECIICEQKETYGHGFAFQDVEDDEYMVHLTCISEDDVEIWQVFSRTMRVNH